MALRARGLTLAHDLGAVCQQLDLDIPAGRITVILGPNGCGKSTLLRGLARLLAPQAGTVLLDGKDLRRFGARELAVRLGCLPQAPQAPTAYGWRSWWRVAAIRTRRSGSRGARRMTRRYNARWNRRA
ncbi:ATP-binding cassette domain-containing protein [Achromobacter xylosoxidans]